MISDETFNDYMELGNKINELSDVTLSILQEYYEDLGDNPSLPPWTSIEKISRLMIDINAAYSRMGIGMRGDMN